MGREWLYRVGGGGGGGTARPSTRKRRMSAEMREDESSTSAGCMCAVLQLFDLHQFQLPLNHQHSFNLHPDSPFLEEEVTTFKEVEAPRNSLELEEPAALKVDSKPLARKEEENLNFSVGIQIKTRAPISASKSGTEDELSINSPGTKTPNLVARLMGLDLLPECNSPSFSCPDSRPQTKSSLNQRKDRNILHTRSGRCFFDDDISVGARSLPETPRISSARRSDVEYHRLSLQINKENMINEEVAKMVARRARFRQQSRDESRSPGHYAKQIVKQVKESVSRRVGLDITNTNRHREEIRRDQNLPLLKLSKKNSKLSPRLDVETSPDCKQSTTPSCSPKLRFLDTKKSKAATDIGIKSPRNSTSSDNYPLQSTSTASKPKHQVIIKEHQQHNDCKKIATGNTLRLKKLPSQTADQAIRNKKEEPFVRSTATNNVKLTDKKSKKAPLSSELLHLSGPNLLPVKKDPSPPATKLPQKQSQVSDALSSKRNTQLSCKTSHSYKLQPDKIYTVPENVLPNNTNGCATTSASPEYKCYIQKILKRAGISDKFTPLTLGKWHTPSHPLDPSIFYYLELFHPTAAASSAAVLGRQCNRKLIFQLVDELLANILRPHLDFKPWVSPIVGNTDHFALADELCKKIVSFQAADCQVLEDIDSLIDTDLCKSPLNGYVEEEGESLVCEIEGEIVEWLVSETVAMVGGRTDEGRRQNRWMSRGELSRDEMPLIGVCGNHPRG